MAIHRRSKHNRGKKSTIKLPKKDTVVIEHLGVRGDGVGKTSDGTVLYVPYTCEGETVIARPVKKRGDGFMAKIESIVTISDKRIPPVCKHFTHCGGCKLQHISDDDYIAYKKRIVQVAFDKQGVDIESIDVEMVDGLRRRARFVSKRVGKSYIGGFHRADSHAVVALEECHVVDPDIWDIFQKMLQILPTCPMPDSLDIHITKGSNGCEVVFYPHGAFDVSLETREVLTESVHTFGLVGVHWCTEGIVEPICMKSPLHIQFGTHTVDVSPAVFLQPSNEGQNILTTILLKYVKAGRIADLFAGSGCFSFPLSRYGHVDAFEGNPDAVHTLNKSAGGKGVQGFVRDLETTPLEKEACNTYSTIVLNPPRLGALAQCRHIANSCCPIVCYISCNPLSLARDSQILLQGGYILAYITLLEQFKYSEHSEILAFFIKK